MKSRPEIKQQTLAKEECKQETKQLTEETIHRGKKVYEKQKPKADVT